MYNSKMIDKYGWIADKKVEARKIKVQQKVILKQAWICHSLSHVFPLCVSLSPLVSDGVYWIEIEIQIQIHVFHESSCLSYQMQICHPRQNFFLKKKLYNLNSFALGLPLNFNSILGIAAIIIIAASM